MSIFSYQQNSRYYKKQDNRNLKKVFRIIGSSLIVLGLVFGGYFFFPFLSWKLYLEPVFASQSYAAPIPQTKIVTKDYIEGLWLNTARSIHELYDSKAQDDWLPGNPYKSVQIATQVSYYFISIPKVNIKNAVVSTVDTDLSSHLVNFPGTAIPSDKGNAVIFGHSTLPPLFDPNNYKTIFANVHTLVVGDTIHAKVGQLTYNYKIYNISIVEPTDTSYLNQQDDNHYLTIVTCTPPGTIWKRLIIKAKMENI